MKVSDSRMQYIFIFVDFSILHAVSNNFWLFAEKRLKHKGISKLSKQCYTSDSFFIVTLYSSVLVTLSSKSAKESCFMNWKGYLFT